MIDAIEIQGLNQRFKDKDILTDVSFSVPKGTALCIIGPSGVGKSTLLRCLNLLTPMTSGKISLNGEAVYEKKGESKSGVNFIPQPELRQRIGMVFQEWNLWPNKMVRKNITEGLRHVLTKTEEEANAIARELCKKVGIASKLDSYPSQLSGGEKQRAAIARALAMRPEVLMLDEITSSLDPSLVGDVLDVIAGLKKEGQTLIIVTHHMNFAKAVSEKIIFLYNGRIVEQGPSVKTLEEPQTAELQNFLQSLKKTY